MTEENQVVAGRYRLLELIGTGAMGAVWKAEDQRLHREVAVKELIVQDSPEGAITKDPKTRAMREGRIAARLLHPNAIAVFDVVEENDRPWLIMEYLPSTSLSDVLAERERLEPPDVASIGAQIASALAAAHAVGIVHRDVKPGNVLLAADGEAKITDFGISRAADDVTVTATGMLAGTPAFFAPEVARGEDATSASDVFSLGSTLYTAVEGKPPFGSGGDNHMALLHRVGQGKFDPPQRAGELAPVLARLLELDPAARPSMTEAQAMLAAIAPAEPTPELHADDAAAGAGPTVALTRPTREEQDRRKRRLVAVAVSAGALLLIAGGTAALFLALRGDDTPPPAVAASTSAPPPVIPSSSPAAPPSSASPPPSSSTPPSPAPPPVVDRSQAMVEAVRSYYALIPGNLQAAYSRLTDRFKASRAPSFASYSSFWGGMSSVEATNITAQGDTVSATIRYTRTGGGTETEHQTYTMVESGGQWLFDSQS